MQLYRAHSQWANRPPDERFETLADLKAHVSAFRASAQEVSITGFRNVLAVPVDRGLAIQLGDALLVPTNWAFSQLCKEIGAPAGYLRSLPAPLAAECLSTGTLPREDWTLLVSGSSEHRTFHALTSPRYGRIWNEDALALVESFVEQSEGRFFNPKDVTGRPSGLYGSDRDVFCFMVDGGALCDERGSDQPLYHGFFVWNSEVGSARFGISTFLFRAVCGNHIVWGAEGVKTLTIRHSQGAPERYLAEAIPILQSAITVDRRRIEATVKRAMEYRLPTLPEALLSFATSHAFTKVELDAAVSLAEAEESGAETLWQLINGFTALARSLPYLDRRIDLERRAGSLLDLVA